MSSKNDFLSVPPRRQHRPLNLSRVRRASSFSQSYCSSCSSTSLQPVASSFQNTSCASSRVDFDNEDLNHDGDMDERSDSSITLFSCCLSPSVSANEGPDDSSHSCSECTVPLAGSSTESQHCSLQSFHEPGQRIAERTRTLRARMTAVVMSLPATVEDTIDIHNHEEEEEPIPNVSIPSTSKLRRVSRVENLRAAFRSREPEPARLGSSSSAEFSKAAYELGFLAPPPRAQSPLSSHPSMSTLVDTRHLHTQRSSDLKTLGGTTLSSISVLSPSVTKLHFRSSLSSHTFSPTDIRQSIFPTTNLHNSPIPRPRHIRSTSLNATDAHISPCSGQRLWSCAKISQSATKLAARRGHHPSKSRVLSNPIMSIGLLS